MDFFEEQDHARKRTRRLIMLFMLAVIAIVILVHSMWFLVLMVSAEDVMLRGDILKYFWNPGVLMFSVLTTVPLIAVGSLYKIWKLSGGGEAVATALGGRRVDPGTSDFAERRLLNVVEEMSIASGVPVPDVYILEHESTINAFAAGYTPSDAVIGVTRGTAQLLNRSELQGVIAHEFSHVLHGDMKLNLRAMGLLHGIFLIAIIGRGMMRAFNVRRAQGIAILGLFLFMIGSIGLFFGRLIQAAISRQREILADASAVQFTRNPVGLAGALKKIGGVAGKSYIMNPAAEEASHMFFGEAVRRLALFEGMMRTHPELGARIRKLEPSWDGTFPTLSLPSISQPPSYNAQPSPGGVPDATAGVTPPPLQSVAGFAEVPEKPAPVPTRQQTWTPAAIEQAVGHIGNPSAAEFSLAQQIHAGLPPALVQASRQVRSAQPLVFGLLFSSDAALRMKEVQALSDKTDPDTAELALGYYSEAAQRSSAERLAIVDLSLPALRRLSEPEYARFGEVIDYLIKSDSQIDLFEYALSRIIRRHLGRWFSEDKETPVKFKAFKPLIPDAQGLLSAVARTGSSVESEIQAAFELGIDALSLRGVEVPLLPLGDCGLKRVDLALRRYDAAAPKLKKNLMLACASVVVADKKITDNEAELLRAIGDAIDVPMPPFVRD